jgi:hypothetical protein
MAAGRLIRIDDEFMQVAQDYSSGTTVNVLRGREGSVQTSHLASVRLTHGLASDFSNAPAQAETTLGYLRATRMVSYSATATVTLPKAGEDLRILIYGTTIALTVPVPTLDLDGCMMTFISTNASAHTITFTGGLGGAGGSYDVMTENGTGTGSFTVVAGNLLWNLHNGTTGTLTNNAFALT